MFEVAFDLQRRALILRMESPSPTSAPVPTTATEAGDAKVPADNWTTEAETTPAKSGATETGTDRSRAEPTTTEAAADPRAAEAAAGESTTKAAIFFFFPPPPPPPPPPPQNTAKFTSTADRRAAKTTPASLYPQATTAPPRWAAASSSAFARALISVPSPRWERTGFFLRTNMQTVTCFLPERNGADDVYRTLLAVLFVALFPDFANSQIPPSTADQIKAVLEQIKSKGSFKLSPTTDQSAIEAASLELQEALQNQCGGLDRRARRQHRDRPAAIMLLPVEG